MWIWGSPRTGSTWLLRMLCDPLEIDTDDPAGFRAPSGWKGPAEALPVEDFFLSHHVAPLMGEPVRLEDGSYVPASLKTFLSGRSPYMFSDAYADVWRPELRRLALLRLNAVVERASARFRLKSPLLVLKEVSGSHATDQVMSLFPRSRLVLLVRDGRDVIDSLLHAYEPGSWLARAQGVSYSGPEKRLELVRREAKVWVANMAASRRAHDQHPQDLRWTIRYEDLRADPARELAPVIDWLGVPWDAARIGSVVERHAFDSLGGADRGPGKYFRAATPGLWRENLSVEERSMAEEIMGPELRALGYPE